ncbi:MAG: hypothetical protein GX316_09800 [Firmicutes bacterium]|nr:hypothetical protein [Bacillota bacterium]
MEKTSAKIAEDITIAWLHAHKREGTMIPSPAEVAEFYKTMHAAVADSIKSQRMRAHSHSTGGF